MLTDDTPGTALETIAACCVPDAFEPQTIQVTTSLSSSPNSLAGAVTVAMKKRGVIPFHVLSILLQMTPLRSHLRYIMRCLLQ